MGYARRALLALGWILISPPAFWLAAAEPVAVPLRFTVFSIRPLENIVLAGAADVLPVPLAFYPTSRSPEYEHPDETPLKFCDANTGALVAEASVPPSIRRALLLFVPQPKGAVTREQRYQIKILDDSGLRHGPGDLAIVNLSGLALGGLVGGRRVSLPAGLNPPVRVRGSAEVELSVVLNGRRYRSYVETVPVAADERALLILFPPFYPGSFEVQGRLLVDTPPAASSIAGP
jgi:hypothetical protein